MTQRRPTSRGNDVFGYDIDSAPNTSPGRTTQPDQYVVGCADCQGEGLEAELEARSDGEEVSIHCAQCGEEETVTLSG